MQGFRVNLNHGLNEPGRADVSGQRTHPVSSTAGSPSGRSGSQPRSECGDRVDRAARRTGEPDRRDCEVEVPLAETASAEPVPGPFRPAARATRQPSSAHGAHLGTAPRPAALLARDGTTRRSQASTTLDPAHPIGSRPQRRERIRLTTGHGRRSPGARSKHRSSSPGLHGEQHPLMPRSSRPAARRTEYALPAHLMPGVASSAQIDHSGVTLRLTSAPSGVVSSGSAAGRGCRWRWRRSGRCR
jgi:hypothetical protein